MAATGLDAVPNPSTDAPRPRVLVVEDDERLGPLVGRMLARAGYVWELATTGDDALRAMRERRPDAVVVDVMIPHPDGIEVCRQFRRDGWAGPMLAMSARNSPDDRRRVLAAGADAFLAKPFPLGDLVASLDGLRAGGRSVDRPPVAGPLGQVRPPGPVSARGD